MAGAESQVMSLWQVSDQGDAGSDDRRTTRRSRPAGRARRRCARRSIEMLRSVKRSHPYYWASFILSGADGPIAFQ